MESEESGKENLKLKLRELERPAMSMSKSQKSKNSCCDLLNFSQAIRCKIGMAHNF